MGAVAENVPVFGMIEGEHQFNKQMADRAMDDAVYQAGQRKRQADRLMKDQISQYGASGILVEGSAADVITEDRADAEVEAMNMIYAGKLQKAQMVYQSRMQRNKAYMQTFKEGASMAAKGG